jgi:hypothetical protein
MHRYATVGLILKNHATCNFYRLITIGFSIVWGPIGTWHQFDQRSLGRANMPGLTSGVIGRPQKRQEGCGSPHSTHRYKYCNISAAGLIILTTTVINNTGMYIGTLDEKLDLDLMAQQNVRLWSVGTYVPYSRTCEYQYCLLVQYFVLYDYIHTACPI